MKQPMVRLLWVLPVAFVIGMTGCDDKTTEPWDHDPPAVPRGLTSITGDREVELRWFPNEEYDLEGYRIYRGDESEGFYRRIGWVWAHDPGSVYQEFYIDSPLPNGETFYYAVSAVDYAGNESDLSWEDVFDTPRPEGRGKWLTSYYDDPDHCAYVFRQERVTDYDDLDADIAYAYDDQTGIAWMWGLDAPDTDYITEIQDAGFAEMDDITWAPADGWTQQAMAELVEGHVYIIWTRDDHYAKFRVTHVDPREVEFDWAYQIARGNQELSADVEVVPLKQEVRPRRTAPVVDRPPRP